MANVLSRSILSSYFWSMVSLALSKGLRLVGVFLCIRQVGDYGWGEIASTVAAYSFVGFIVDQGLSSSPLLYRLNDRGADSRLLALISGYRLAVAAVVILAIHGAHALTGIVGPLALAYSLVLIPRALSIEWWFHRREYYQMNMFVGVVRSAVFFGLIVLFVRQGTSARVVIYVEMISEAVSVALSFALMRLARAPAAVKPSPPISLRHLLAFSFPILLLGVLINVQASMDLLVLRLFMGNEQVALYDMGMKISLLYFFVGGTIIQIIRPKLTRLQEGRDMRSMGEILRAVSGPLLLVGGLALIPSLFFSEACVAAIYGNSGNREVTSFVFRWAALWVNISFLTIMTADTLLALGHRKAYLAGAIICALTNTVGNLVLLQGLGAHWAVFAKILSEGSFFAFAYLKLPGEVRGEIRGALTLQGLTVAFIVGTYLVSDRFGMRETGMAVSLLFLAGLLLSGRLINRKSLQVLRRN